jgi:flagella basal body P-ring formation protein FlgA
MSGNKGAFGPHLRVSSRVLCPYSGGVAKTVSTLRLLLLACLFLLAGHARAQTPAPEADPLVEQARRFAIDQLTPAQLPRFEVIAGRLDARLRLAPCEEVKPYLPTGTRLWGKTRVGLRCVKGVTAWNVYVPLTVNVYGPAMVSTSALPAGHVLQAADLRQADVNLSEDPLNNRPIADQRVLLGRTLAKALVAGQGVKSDSLKSRQWFAAGDQVQIQVEGVGFAVAGSGEAVTAGFEGQPARVRTESGRTVTGLPVADKQLAVSL